ncbi:sensor histidine kinase [Flexivirga sp. B27]
MTLALPGISHRRHVWGEVWRIAAAAIVGFLVLIGEIVGDAKGYGPPHAWAWIDAGLGVVSLVLLHWRRRFPFGICLVLTAMSTVSAVSAISSAVALISLTTHRRWRPVVLCSAAGVAAGLIYQLLFPTPDGGLSEWISTIAIGVLAIALCVAIGAAIGARRLLVDNLRTQLAVAEDRQHLRTEQARVAERARIAREMHDVLAHRISLVAMHSGALSYRTNLSAEELQQSTAIISDNAHAALTELREVLGVLRDPTSVSQRPDAPQPTLADLPALVAGVRSADGPVYLDLPDNLSGLTELTSRNAYRIVQEGLTNRRKHAPGQPISIELAHADDDLRLSMRNPLTSVRPDMSNTELLDLPDSGLGLVGATERAELLGGELTSGVDRADNFVIHARLPWPRDDS